jgi:hypothetical protein
MSFRIRDGLSYCLCDERPIFLDIDSGRYSTLPARLCASFSTLMTGDRNVSRGDLERLIALRVIELGSRTDQQHEILPVPDCEIMPTKLRSWPVNAILAQAMTTHRVRHVTLRRLLAEEAALQLHDRSSIDERDLGRLRGAFERIATLFGEADECLPRSLAFRRLAFQRGHRPSLVIGVKIDPFGAHCWVQSGSRVDSDSVERVRLFTPILVV